MKNRDVVEDASRQNKSVPDGVTVAQPRHGKEDHASAIG